MTELAHGAYEHIVTAALERRLSVVNPELVQRRRLDPADAHETLSRHIAALTRRALRAVSGSDEERLAKQIAITNQIAAAIADAIPAAAGADDLLATSRENGRSSTNSPPNGNCTSGTATWW